MTWQKYALLALLTTSTASVPQQHTTKNHAHEAIIAQLSNDRLSDDLVDCPQHFWGGHIPTIGQLAPTTENKLTQDWHALCFGDFALLYSGKTRTALYTAHHLTDDEVATAKTLDRIDSFRPEPFLPHRVQVDLSDYKGVNYDRGHLVPNGDMATRQAQYDSFSLANIVPQNREHNRGIWRQIEQKTRTLASDFGEAYIITGTAYHGQTLANMNGVLVPSHLYKIVYLPSVNQAGVYYSPNDNSLTYEVIDLSELEQRTGIKIPLKPQFNKSLFLVEGQDSKPLLSLWVWLKMMFVNLWESLGQ